MLNDMQLTSNTLIELDNGSRLDVLEVVRVVPGNRQVLRGTWAGQAVFAKKFIGARAKEHFVRDLAGVKSLVDAKIVTPGLLFQGWVQAEHAYVAVFTAIQNAQNAEELWQVLDDEARFNLAQKLVQTIAQHHRAGLLQTDLYLKNFLVQQKLHAENLGVESPGIKNLGIENLDQADLIYTLDGDGIRRLSVLFQKRQKLRNLATLFSKMDVLNDGWIAELYAQYCLQSGMVCSPVDEAQVWLLTQKIRHQVVNRYADKKVFRTCTDVKVTQSFKRFQAVASDFCEASQELVSLDHFLADAKSNIKNGNTCTIAKAVLANQSVIIKRYNIKNFWHGLNRAFRISRAAKSWANAHRLIISNIATPKPLALVEERFGCLRRRAYYLSEYVDAPDVMQFFAQTSKFADKATVARNLATVFYKLYLLKFSHGDCKATNIKIVNLAPVLIDLDGLQSHFGGIFGDWWFKRKHIKDLKRLMRNWASDAEVTALLKQAFLLEYTAQYPFDNDDILFRAGFV